MPQPQKDPRSGVCVCPAPRCQAWKHSSCNLNTSLAHPCRYRSAVANRRVVSPRGQRMVWCGLRHARPDQKSLQSADTVGEGGFGALGVQAADQRRGGERAAMGLGKGHRHDLSGPPVLVTENVEDYRKAIPVYLKPEDVVLELGCAQGVTTGLIADVVSHVIGIDKSDYQTRGAQARNPNVTFLNIDAFDAGAVLKLGYKFTVIFIDISGNRPVGDVVQLIDSYEAVFQPRLFVVKCYKLKRLMGMSKVFPEDCIEGRPPFTGNEHSQLQLAGPMPQLIHDGASPQLDSLEASAMGMHGGQLLGREPAAAAGPSADVECGPLGNLRLEPRQESETLNDPLAT